MNFRDIPEPCLCGATDCPRCFPLTYHLDDDEDDEDEAHDDYDYALDPDPGDLDCRIDRAQDAYDARIYGDHLP